MRWVRWSAYVAVVGKPLMPEVMPKLDLDTIFSAESPGYLDRAFGSCAVCAGWSRTNSGRSARKSLQRLAAMGRQANRLSGSYA